jgi:hypothetical protein
MALNEFDQSLLGNESLTSDLSESDLSLSNLSESSTALEETTNNNSADNVSTNLLVQSINQQGVPVGPKPKNVSSGSPLLRSAVGQSSYKNFDDYFSQNERMLYQNPLYQTSGSTPKYVTAKEQEKFDDQDYGYIYGIDNEDEYGKMESSWITVGKAIPRFVIGTIDKVAQGFGFIGGLAYGAVAKGLGAYEGENIIDIASDNAVMNTLNQFDEWTKNEWLPTFQEAADREKGFWARAYSDLDFWTNDFVDGISFLAAAWIPGAILGEAGAGAAMAARLARAGKALGVVGDVSSTVQEASALTRWFSQTGKAARNLDAFNSWAIATSSEAMFEASAVRKDILESPDYDKNGDPIINFKTGRPFTVEEKKEMASQAALNTFVMNATILSVSNAFEYKYLSKLMGRAAPAVEKEIIGGAANLGEEAVVKAASPLWKTVVRQTGLGTLREGFYEENMQLAIQRYNTKYGIEGKIGGMLDVDTWGNVLKQASKQTIDAIYGNDSEAAQSIGMGGLIGSIFGSATTRYQENKEQKNAEAVMAAFNNSQNSFLKFGDVFKYNIVDSTDKEGNPIKTKQIVLDSKGNPVYDYDKIHSIAAQMKVNSDMIEDSYQESDKFKQEFLRTMGWADFVNAHINAGLEKTLMAKLDKLTNADPASLAKLGFIRDENFPAQLEKYKTIASEIIAQNKALTDNVIFNNTSFFDKKNVVDNNRRAHLTEIISRQVVYKSAVNELSKGLQTLKSNLLTDDQTDLSDGLVDQLNTSLYRIAAQEASIQSMKDNGSDKILPMQVYEKVLENLKSAHAELIKDNETSLKDVTLNQDGTYRYKKTARNDQSIKDQIDIQAFSIAGIKNEILNDNQLFAFFADRSKGRENYTKFHNAITAVKTKQAEEKVAQEKEKKSADEARAQIRKETEHKVIKEINGTFTIVDPNGIIVSEGILIESEANQEANELTAKLVAKKAAELKAKEEEEKRKQQQQGGNQPLTLAEKKTLLQDKENRANQLINKGVQDSSAKLQELIDQGKTINEAEAITENEWLATPDGKEYSKLIAEIEALEKEIKDEESGKGIPTLEEFLKEKYDNLLLQNPNFKLSYDNWYKTGTANGFIKDYNMTYGKTEKLVSVSGTSSGTETTDEEAIGNLDLRDVDEYTIEAVLRQVRKIYQQIAGDAGLLQQLKDKINEVVDDLYKNYLLQALVNKAVSSSYIPLSTVGINPNVQEHKTYGKINMPLEEFMLGFTLVGDPRIIEIFSSSTGDITDRVNAVATVEYIRKAQAQLAAANIPNRTIITNETPKDIARLKEGASIIAKSHKANNFNLQLFLKDKTTENIYVGGIGNYAIVNPDNTTEKIEWREDQREFVKNNMLIDGKKMTDQQYNTLQEMYNKMQAFEESVMELLSDHLKTYPNETSMDVTPFFKDVFTLSGKFTATTGELLQDVVKRAGPDRLFTVQVADENDVVTQKRLPLFAFKEKTIWRYEFPLNPGERIVTLDEDNNIQPILDFKEYLQDELGLAFEMRDAFPGARAWLSKAENQARGYTPYKLSLIRIERPDTFKTFATAFKNLKKAIEDGIAEDKNIFKYEGVTYNTINDLMMAFNIDHYGFYQYKGFVANLSYNSKAKVNGETVGRFLFELRPQDKKARLALTSDQKRALNMYISDDAMLNINDTMSDEDILTASQTWVDGLVRDFDKLTSKLAKSKDTLLQKMVDQSQEDDVLDYHLLFEYELKNDVKSFKLKLVNKALEEKNNSVELFPLLKFDGKNIDPDKANTNENNLRLSFNDGVATITQPKPAASIVPAAPVASISDIEAKKADINNKWDETIKRIEKQYLAGYSNPNEGYGGKNAGFSFAVYDINERRNAELAALESQVTDTENLTTGSTVRRIIVDEINPDDNDAPFMLEETEESYEQYTEASFNEEIQWLKKALAGTGVKLVDLGTIINNLVAKKNVLGYYKDKAIYVSEALSKKGTIYHEAFHALFRDVLTNEQRVFFLDKIRSKVGYITNDRVETFRNERGYFNKTDEQIRDLIYEEYLADGFRDFKLNQKQPKEGWFKKFIALFDRIINFFKSKQTDIEGLYEDFDAGRYSGKSNQASTISKEGVYSIAYGRPKLFVKEGAVNFSRDNTQVLNLNLQNELVYKLTNIIATQSQGTFTEKFNNAVQQVKKDYNIDDLIKNSADPATFDKAIRFKYGEMFNDALYILGDSVPYTLSDELLGAADAMSERTVEGSNKDSLNVIKEEVQSKIDSLGLSKGFDVDDLEIPESDEDRVEREKGGEFDTIHMNPLEGLSREFRSLFSTIPYKYEDAELGVTINKMTNGDMLFNAMIKIAANTPLDQILPSLTKAVDMMKEDNDPTSVQLQAFVEFIQKQFGITDLSDSTARPTKNIYLYKQFIDTFFITELPSKQVVLKTTDSGSTVDIIDASISADVALKKEAIGLFYDQAYGRLNTPEAKEEFNQKFRTLQDYIKNSLFVAIKDSSIVNARAQQLNKVVDKMKKMLDDINIILPKNLIRQSFLAIYNLENGLEFTPQSKQNRIDMEADQRLMKEGAYLQSDFFFDLSNISEDNFGKIFAKTKESYVDLGRDFTKIDTLNGILRKAMKYVIKYDVNSAIPVFQNAENKKIWRYSKYTPPVLLTQMVREEGIRAITDLYPVLRAWYGDNPLFDGSPENQLFLENLYMSSFGGFRQEIDDDSKVGVTFGSIDTKALLISGIVNFMNRETITKKMKGIKDPVTITTYERSRTQEEATTTNFLMTAKYQKLINKDGVVNNTMIDNLTQMIGQEYNRIQREWQNREDTSLVRYEDYNNNIHPETKQPIQGDSYTTLDGKVVQLRAYQFKNFEHFFEQQKTTDNNQAVREALRDVLKEAAKNGLPFSEALKQSLPNTDNTNVTASEFLNEQLRNYMDETFDAYRESLMNNKILIESKGAITSELIPGTIKQDFKSAKPIQDYGYETLENMLKDLHLNTFLNKLLVNQIFDGDIATGIKSIVEYYKRNRAGVISGNSMKFGFFRTSVVENIQTEINAEDLMEYAKDISDDTLNKDKVDIADGQSYHVMNHRIRMMDSWGRLDSEVRELLNAAKYRKLTKEEIEKLDGKKVVLNTIKTATGGVFEYYKLSEHLISRTEVSHLVLQPGQEIEDAHDALDDLYSQIETLEDSIVADPYRENADVIEQKLVGLYNEVHKYWQPKRSRAKLHYLLNSMELSGVDQLFDPNASKKTTIVPVKLNENDITDLKASKSITSGLFKFMQVETSGVKNKITLPTQARQLLTTYLGKLNTKAYNNKTIAQLANDYATTLGKITNSNMKALDARLLDKDGNINIVELYKMMYEGLKEQGADANTLKFFEIKNGKPKFNPNMLVIKKLFTYYYFSMFNNSVFSESVSGRSDILVSSFGHDILYDTQTGDIITSKMQEDNPDMYKSERYATRPLGVDVETINGKKVYTVEVIIPEPLAYNASEKALYLEKLNKFFSTRIPTEDKRSMIVCKVVDYMEASYRNSIVVPQLVHILAGSDLDVDKLYSHTFAHYINFNGEATVYGDYSGYATASQGKFIEYIHYMMNENPAIKDSIKAEIKTVEAKPIFSSDFIKLRDEIGLSDMEYTAEELKEKRRDLAVIVDALFKEKKELQKKQNVLFQLHIDNNQRMGSEGRAMFIQTRDEYRAIRDLADEKEEELKAIKKEQELLNNTIRLAATINVLKNMSMPITQSGLTTYMKDNANPVVAVLQNESLQQKMDILSNEDVFNNFYIKEKSTVEPFRDIAKSIGASVADVVKANSLHSIMGDVVANEINSSNKDGIGISASFNKFLAFAEKSGLSLQFSLFGTVSSELSATEFGTISETSTNFQEHNNFLNSDAIRNIGAQLGMFADAVKDPIPSVLNLNPETAGTSNLLISMSGNIQLGLLMNKIPFIEKITKEVSISKSAAQTNETKFDSKKTASILKSNFIKPAIEKLQDEKRLAELYEKDKDGNIIMGEMLPMYIETGEPNSDLANIDLADETITDYIKDNQGNLNKIKRKVTLADVGFSVKYKDGSVVAEDVAAIYLAEVYRSASKINTDIIKLGAILNLIKDQKPEFNTLDQLLSDYAYFMSGKSVFGESIIKILISSAEYKPLVEAAQKMSDYSKQLLIERTPLFRSINNILQTNFSNAKDPKAKQNISDQITKLIIIYKTKIDLEKRINSLQGKDDLNSVKERRIYEESLEYFTSDYWLNNNTFVDDLDYLYATNPGNPFVEFLKVNIRKNIDYLEGSSRMKLDKDVAENINNGYEALQKSSDERTMILSRQLFYYTLLKDGLGYSNNSFLSYLNPDLKGFKDVSDNLDKFQELLADQQKFINEQNKNIQQINNSGITPEDKIVKIKEIADKVYANYTALFDKFFQDTNPGKIDWINLIVRKIFSNAMNQKYVPQYFGANVEDQDSKNLFNDVIAAGVFSNLTTNTKVFGKKFDFTKGGPSSFDIDFTSLLEKKDSNMMLENVFGNIFSPNYNANMEFEGMTFPMLIKNSEGRLFKLMTIDNKLISEDIAYQSITGVYKGTNGAKAKYSEIEIEGTNNILNFGFKQADGIALYKRSQEKFNKDVDADLLALGVTPSEISDNKSKKTIQSQLGNVENQNIPSEPLDVLSLEDQASMDEAKAKMKAKQKGKQSTFTSSQPKNEDELTDEDLQYISEAKAKRNAKIQGQQLQANEREYTPEKLTKQNMPKNGIFVFGSNTEGRHGLGAALTAKEEFNAKQGQAKGLQGQSYAIITKDLSKGKRSVSLNEIRRDVTTFIDFAYNNPQFKFYVTKLGSKLAGYSIEEIKDIFKGINSVIKIPDNVILPQEYEVRNSEPTQVLTGNNILMPNTTSARSIDYTPKNEPTQTYTIQGSKIFNKAGDEVFAEDSIDRNKIFANLAVKEGRAKVVQYEGVKYVVNKKNQIISGATGKIIQWDERNKKRIAVLALANNPPLLSASDNIIMSDSNAITDADIASIYRDKLDYFNAQYMPAPSLEEFSAQAKKIADDLKKINRSKEQILEALKCL